MRLQEAKFESFGWHVCCSILIFVGIPYIVNAASRSLSAPSPTPQLRDTQEARCVLIDGYQIGMSIQTFKNSYPKNLALPVCRTSGPKMVRCDGQMEINKVKTLVSFDFGYGNDYKDGTQFKFGNGKLLGLKGSFEMAEMNYLMIS